MTTNPPQDEQRKFRRIPFEGIVYLLSNTVTLQGLLHDLSLKGALITRPESWQGQVGDVCRLQIHLAHFPRPLTMEASVAHIGADRIGLCCHHIDIESATQLKRLVELNLGDATLLERELKALLQ